MLIETMKLWENREDVELTTFLTLSEAEFGEPVKRPAIIVCPGGAYMSCPRHGSEGDQIAMTYAVDGYQCFVLEYSVATKAPEGACRFPKPMLDLGKAVLTVREHAKEWAIDPEQISLIGFSAGAHLCSMYATTWQEEWYRESLGITDNACLKPMSAILIYGLFDYVEQERARKEKPGAGLPGDINIPVFGTETPDLKTQERFSPICHVTDQTPPMFLAAAVDDGLVPSIQSLHMAEKLHEAHIPYELHMFRYGDHGFALGRNFFEPFREDKRRACAEWVPLSKTFLLHQISEESRKLEASPFAGLRKEE